MRDECLTRDTAATLAKSQDSFQGVKKFNEIVDPRRNIKGNSGDGGGGGGKEEVALVQYGPGGSSFDIKVTPPAVGMHRGTTNEIHFTVYPSRERPTTLQHHHHHHHHHH
ncbi:hypothetical protein V1478_016284 [Vespula squamosa]|uniref:Uncharacterized protein n=1 Tax=Vespula squamosa TaxID=30214 RepID=A0ABD1ZZW7_VESSQ